MHVTTHSTNINFTVPTSSPNIISSNTNSANQRQVVGDQQQQQYQQSNPSAAQHGSASCDTEDEIPASVISSVGTVNYQQSSHQILFVSTASRFTTPPNHEIAQQYQQHRTAIANATVSDPSSPIGKMVHSQQHINVSAANQQPPPRQHPKKRKFNPSELEEMAPTTTSATAPPTQSSSSATPADITHSNGNGTANGAPSSNNTQPQTIEPAYTFATVPAKMISLASVMEDDYKSVTTTCANSSPATAIAQQQQQSTQPLYPVCLLVSTPAQSNKIEEPKEKDTLNLQFFYSHRVLAKKSDYYAAGALAASEIPNSIVVKFDGRVPTQQIYYDVFDSGRNEVISDACPSANDVCIVY